MEFGVTRRDSTWQAAAAATRTLARARYGQYGIAAGAAETR